MVLAGEVTLTFAFCAASSPTSRSTLSLKLGNREVPPASNAAYRLQFLFQRRVIHDVDAGHIKACSTVDGMQGP